MNTYIKMQLINMIRYLDGFEQACELAAVKDDGVVDEEEKKQLDRIRKAVRRFRNDLGKI